MVAEFEQRLADVLGTRMPLPFRGRVEVSPGTLPGPSLVLGAERVSLQEPDFGSRRPEVVPGDGAPRRIVRATCTVGVVVRAQAGQGRAQQMQGLDAALYTLDAADIRDGSALRTVGDPGFVIDALRCTSSVLPLDPAAPWPEPIGLRLEADGWFWPVGTPGGSGIAIGEIRVRGVSLPVLIRHDAPALVAGGGPIPIVLALGGDTAFRLGGGGALPNAPMVARIEGPGARAASGTLGGGAAGAGGVRLASISQGELSFVYTPGAEAATDTLILSFDNGDGGAGAEIGRFALDVREG